MFALCAGARTTNAPGILVFVGHELGVDGTFLGYIHATDAFRLLRTRRPALRYVHDLAESIARYVTTVGSTTPQPIPPRHPFRS